MKLKTYLTCFLASEIMEKYEKPGNYLPILQEATCDNYCIVKCLLKSNSFGNNLLTAWSSLLNTMKSLLKNK